MNVFEWEYNFKEYCLIGIYRYQFSSREIQTHSRLTQRMGRSQGIQLDASNSNQLFEKYNYFRVGWESNWNFHIPTQFRIIPHPRKRRWNKFTYFE